jgi:hypothetical protein
MVVAGHLISAKRSAPKYFLSRRHSKKFSAIDGQRNEKGHQEEKAQ